VGISFQIGRRQVDNLSDSMRTQLTMAKIGRGVSALFQKKREENHFKNMVSNFGSLIHIADNGNLRIFPETLPALYNATPSKYKDKADPAVNHMASLLLINNVQMFANLTLALKNAKDQGTVDNIVNNLMGIVLIMGPNDVEALRQTLTALVTRAKKGNPAPLDLLLSNFWPLKKIIPRDTKTLKIPFSTLHLF